MSFWDFVYKVWPLIANRITRILAFVSGTLAVLTGTGIIPEAQLKYYVAAIALLTFWRGQSTGKTYEQAKAVLAANPPTVSTVAAVAKATSGIPPIDPPEVSK